MRNWTRRVLNFKLLKQINDELYAQIEKYLFDFGFGLLQVCFHFLDYVDFFIGMATLRVWICISISESLPKFLIQKHPINKISILGAIRLIKKIRNLIIIPVILFHHFNKNSL